MRGGLPSGFSHNCRTDRQIIIALQLDAPHHFFFSADGEKAAAPGEGLRRAKTKKKKRKRKNKKGGKATELEVS